MIIIDNNGEKKNLNHFVFLSCFSMILCFLKGGGGGKIKKLHKNQEHWRGGAALHPPLCEDSMRSE